MKLPSLYLNSFKPFQHIYADILKEFGHTLKWKGNDTLLDIGCGPGNVTRDVLVPMMPKNFAHVTGADYSEEMLSYARKHFQHPRVKYQFLDINEDVDKENSNQYDHITSFNCLHWAKDLNKSMKNVHTLLRPGGDCLLAFIYHGLIFDVFHEISKDPKWSKYFSQKERILPILHHSNEPIEDSKSALKNAGFKDYNVVLRERVTETTKQNYRDMMHSIDTFFDRIPDNAKDDYLKDEMVLSKKFWKNFAESNDDTFTMYYSQIVCHARKEME